MNCMIWFSLSKSPSAASLPPLNRILSAQTGGVIFKTERVSFRVLDQNGQVRLVQPHQISMCWDSSRAIDSEVSLFFISAFLGS